MAGPFYVDDGGGKAVTGAFQENPCRVTVVGHGFSNGQKVVFHNVVGMTAINFTNLSTGYTVTVVDADNITIGVDGTGFGAWSSGGTAHNGLSWGASFLSLSALSDVFTSFASNEIIYIGHDHVCQYAHTASKTLVGPTIGAPTLIYSVTQGSNPVTYQASTTNQWDTSEGVYTATFDGSFAVFGVRTKSGATVVLGSDHDEVSYFYGCDFAVAANQNLNVGAGNTGKCLVVNCNIDLTADGTTVRSGYVITGSQYGKQEIIGMTFTNPAYRTGAISGAIGVVLMHGCDFSGFSNPTLCEIFGVQPLFAIVSDCKTPTTWAPVGSGLTVVGCRIEVSNCGPVPSPEQLHVSDFFGTSEFRTNVYRDGGATVNGKLVSCLFTTTANADENRQFYGAWSHGRIDTPGVKTFTMYAANNTGNLKDSEVWMEVEPLTTSGSPMFDWYTDQRSATGTGSLNVLAADNNQTADPDSTWYGTTLTYRQKLQVTATVNQAGFFRARVVAAKPLITDLYIDPDVVVT